MRPKFNIDQLDRAVSHLKGKRVLIITTSTRWEGENEKPKSTLLAEEFAKRIEGRVEIVDASKLHIYQCEGNVSSGKGNSCGVKESVLKDGMKNPSGQHRCWASINHSDDELWKVSKPLLDSDVILFFVSVRWGSANAVYQKVIERLNWLENRHTTLGEDNIIKNKEAGIIAIGHNWNGGNVVELQKQVLQFYGFQVPEELSFNWQWTSDPTDESQEGYKAERGSFKRFFGLINKLNESFKDWINEKS
jgi:multimeric flavodoxin WrbA